jgi:sulfite reductase alpha subunit-like flavoprotein
MAEPESLTVDSARRSVLVLYGSETGNSQDIAEELGRNAQRLYFKTSVEELNDVQLVCDALSFATYLPCSAGPVA